MTTVDLTFATNLVSNNGYYNGDSDNSLGDNPRVIEIVHYTNQWGGDSYGCVFEGQNNRYTESMYVRSPSTFWKYNPSYDSAV